MPTWSSGRRELHSSDSMRILLVHDFYQQYGGEDAVALAERRLLEQHAEDVLFYSRDNAEIRDYNLPDKLAFLLGTIYSHRTRREIAALARLHRPDAAYVHNVFPLISPSLYHVLQRLKVPIVQVVHEFRLLCPNSWFYTEGRICERCKHGNYLHAIRHRCYRDSYVLSALYSASIGINRLAGGMDKIDAFICLTEFSKLKLLEIGVPEEKLYVRPNFIDASAVSPAPGTGDYVMYLGRLSPEKGVWTLVRAFEQLRGVPLKIVGTGPLEGDIRRYVEEKGLRNISLTGFKAGKEKWELLRNSRFVVLPSEWYEAFPMVILEAYAAGKPVIASNLGGLPYIVRNGQTGLLFEAGNPFDLADKTSYLLQVTEELERMGRFARKLTETEYSPEAGYETLMTILDKVCKQ